MKFRSNPNTSPVTGAFVFHNPTKKGGVLMILRLEAMGFGGVLFNFLLEGSRKTRGLDQKS